MIIEWEADCERGRARERLSFVRTIDSRPLDTHTWISFVIIVHTKDISLWIQYIIFLDKVLESYE